MSTDEKPLYVQVAEAIGWRDIKYVGGLLAVWASHHDGIEPGNLVIDSSAERKKLPRYDLEWGATGPLIAVYGIGLNYFVCDENCCPPDGVRWTAVYGSLGLEHADKTVEARDPLIAVCRLIIALHAEGKLGAAA